jgi:hypothetical protein
MEKVAFFLRPASWLNAMYSSLPRFASAAQFTAVVATETCAVCECLTLNTLRRACVGRCASQMSKRHELLVSPWSTGRKKRKALKLFFSSVSRPLSNSVILLSSLVIVVILILRKKIKVSRGSLPQKEKEALCPQRSAQGV